MKKNEEKLIKLNQSFDSQLKALKADYEGKLSAKTKELESERSLRLAVIAFYKEQEKAQEKEKSFTEQVARLKQQIEELKKQL